MDDIPPKMADGAGVSSTRLYLGNLPRNSMLAYSPFCPLDQIGSWSWPG